MMSKYIKTDSMTWWVSVFQIFLGLVIATEPLHGLTVIVGVINELTGGIGAYPLISAGLVGVGIRRAIG